jgi:uncharacterized membrane protein (Fun14 family)
MSATGRARAVLPCLGVNVDLTSVMPWVQQLSFGAVAGFVAGFALKKVGKFVALTLGVLFVVIQLLAWSGYLSVDWGRIQASVDPLLEPTRLEQLWQGLLAMLTYNLPFGAAFVAALVIGLRRG